MPLRAASSSLRPGASSQCGRGPRVRDERLQHTGQRQGCVRHAGAVTSFIIDAQSQVALLFAVSCYYRINWPITQLKGTL